LTFGSPRHSKRVATLQSNVKFRTDATVGDKNDGALVSYSEEQHPDGTKPGRSFAFALTHVYFIKHEPQPQLSFCYEKREQLKARYQAQWGKADELAFRLLLTIPLYEALIFVQDSFE
jgi:hypothetical protein